VFSTNERYKTCPGHYFHANNIVGTMPEPPILRHLEDKKNNSTKQSTWLNLIKGINVTAKIHYYLLVLQ